MANKTLKTTPIKGKDYVEVNERLKAFRTMPEFKGYSLVTVIKEFTQDYVLMQANIYDADKNIVASGCAYEEKNSSNINRTSYVENCETSAWGRALGNLGIGIDKAVCSAQELLVALHAQEEAAQAPKKNEIYELLAAVEECQSYEELLALWNAHPELQEPGCAFYNAVAIKGQTFPKK